MLEATTYTRICGQQQLVKCVCVAGSQPMSEKFSYAFCVRKYLYNEKKQITVLTYMLARGYN